MVEVAEADAGGDGVDWGLLEASLERVEAAFGLLVVNPLWVKQRRGHKTDKADAEFIAEQLKTDSLRSSFIPEQGQREPRDLARRRENPMQDRNRLATRSTGCWRMPTSS
jgi:transposase